MLHVTHKSSYNPDGNPLTIGEDVTVGHKVMLHGCTMVYDDAENSFSYQKNTLLTVSYQNAYRRVNNLFAQEILRYCEMLRVLDNEYPRFLEFQK